MKKILIVILTFLMVLSFGACKSRHADTDNNKVPDSKASQSEKNLSDDTVSGDENGSLAERPENQAGDNVVADVWENTFGNISDTKAENSSLLDDSEPKPGKSPSTDAPATDNPSADSPSEQPSLGENTGNEEVLNTNPTYEGDEGWLPWR